MTIGKRKLGRGFLLLIIAVLGIALFASCGRRHHKPMTDAQVKERAANGAERFMDGIEATEEQRAVITAEVDQLVPQFNKLRKIKTPTKEKALAEITKDKPDAGVLRGILTGVHDQVVPFGHVMIDSALRTHAVLTPEQREKIAEKMEAHKGRHRGKSSWVVDAVFKRFLDEINATEEQYEYALGQKAELLEELKGLKANREETKEFALKQLRAEKADASLVHGRLDSSAATFLAFGHKVTDSVAEFVGTLSPEQREKVRELIGEMKN